jgi:hypothetical protein
MIHTRFFKPKALTPVKDHIYVDRDGMVIYSKWILLLPSQPVTCKKKITGGKLVNSIRKVR